MFVPGVRPCGRGDLTPLTPNQGQIERQSKTDPDGSVPAKREAKTENVVGARRENFGAVILNGNPQGYKSNRNLCTAWRTRLIAYANMKIKKPLVVCHSQVVTKM